MRNAFPAVAAFAVVLHLAGCDRQGGGGPGPRQASAMATGDTPAEAAALSASARPPVADSGTRQIAGAAQAMLQDWRAAMEGHDFPRARSFFGNGGTRSGMSDAQFARVWDKYRIIDMTIGTGQIEGAAGSSYYEVPVTITGLTREGRPYNLAGTVTARRVNGVPGATAEQLRWHIDSTSLNP